MTSNPNRKTWILILCLCTAAALVAGIVIARLTMGGGDAHAGHGPTAGDNGAPTRWTCAMHPQVITTEPGKCPICGMALTPLDQTKRQLGPRQYEMSPEAVALANIQTTPVIRTLPEARVRLFGKVDYDETRVRTISARFPARIERLYVDYTGIRVEKNDHLAKIYSPELLTAQSELLSRLRFRPGTEDVDAARDKLRLWGFPDEAIKAIEESGKASDEMDIDAPAGGIVIQKNVREGDYVQTGSPMFKIADFDKVWVQLDAYESDLPWLRYGQTVEFTVEGIPGTTFEGQIAFIDPEVDPMSRTVKIRVNADNEESLLKPGMFVTAEVVANVAEDGKVMAPELAGKWISPMHPEIVSDEPGKCTICGMDLVRAEKLGYAVPGKAGELPLVIPASAVLQTGKRAVVYVELPIKEGQAPIYEGRVIELGPRAGDVYVVESGLHEGEKVVTEGAFKIDSAMQILAKPSMMNSDEPGPAFEAPDEFKAQLMTLLDSYYGIQSALAADDFDGAKKAGEGFLAALKEVKPEGLDADALTAWTPLAGVFAEQGPAVTGASDIEAARQAFHSLSDHLLEAVRNFGLPQDSKSFVMHCPMAFQNTGADWLQPGEELRNPYFGARMLKCGTRTEELRFDTQAKPGGAAQPGHIHVH